MFFSLVLTLLSKLEQIKQFLKNLMHCELLFQIFWTLEKEAPYKYIDIWKCDLFHGDFFQLGFKPSKVCDFQFLARILLFLKKFLLKRNTAQLENYP